MSTTNNEEPQQISISKEAITVLVQLVQLAQKKGAYSLDESYLAFNAINTIVDDPKFKRTQELVQNLFTSKESTQVQKESGNTVVNESSA